MNSLLFLKQAHDLACLSGVAGRCC